MAAGVTENENAPRGIAQEISALLRLAAPITLAQVGQAMMGFVDTAVVGRVGAAPLAAVGLANLIFFTLSIFGVGLVLGIDPLVAQALGAGEQQTARRAYWQGVLIALLATVGLTPLLVAVGLLLRHVGLEPSLASLCARVLWLRLPGLAPMLVFFAARSYLQSVERPGAIVLATVAANVLNLFGDVYLVFGGASLPASFGLLRAMPALGAAGSAICTSACTVIQLVVISLGVGRISARRDARRIDPVLLRSALRVGLPVGLHYTAEVGIFALAGVLAGRLGDASLAAHQIALVYSSLSFCLSVGVGSAGSVRVGLAIGAEDSALARRAGFIALAAGGAFMGLCAFGLYGFRAALASLVTNKHEVAALAAPLLSVTAVYQVSDGLQGVGAGILRGAGDSRFTLLANLVGHYGVGLPIALVALSNGAGVIGIWWGLCAGLTAVALALFARFWRLSSRPILRVSGVTH